MQYGIYITLFNCKNINVELLIISKFKFRTKEKHVNKFLSLSIDKARRNSALKKEFENISTM